MPLGSFLITSVLVKFIVYTCQTGFLTICFLGFTELQNEVSKSRRVLAILSPAVFSDQWEAPGVYEAMKQLQGLGSKLSVVALKKLPKSVDKVKNSQGETLNSLVRMLTVVVWERSQDDKFWMALRFRLPPKRGDNDTIVVGNTTSRQGENSSRLTADSTDESCLNYNFV